MSAPRPPRAARVAGVDEAGRGPLAGPVVAAAVILDPMRPIDGLADSKVLSAAQREHLAPLIRERALAWAVGLATAAEIDTVNILQATFLAMRRALAGLVLAPTQVLVDGNRLPRLDDVLPGCPALAIIGGDAIEPAISAASILAKTYRDALMTELDLRHPAYGFAGHKGYGTAAHLVALRAQGPCEEHRRSFRPVREAAAGAQSGGET